MKQRIKSHLTRGRALLVFALVSVLLGSSMGALYSFGVYPVGLQGGGAQMTDDAANEVKR